MQLAMWLLYMQQSSIYPSQIFFIISTLNQNYIVLITVQAESKGNLSLVA